MTDSKEYVMFPVPKDLVEQFIKVYSGYTDCGGCDSPINKPFLCVVCEKMWDLCGNCDDNLGNYNGPEVEICDHCEGWICKECVRKFTLKYPGTAKGIREQMFCEYDLEKGREFHRDENEKLDNHVVGQPYPPIIDYFDTYSHQSKFGNLLCGKCIEKVPRCERCNHTLYLCTSVSGDGCCDKNRTKELQIMHNEFSCDDYLEAKLEREEREKNK